MTSRKMPTQPPEMSAVSDATSGRVQARSTDYRADPERVHVAVLRDGLWSPKCSNESGWVAPLASHSHVDQATCETCLYDVLYADMGHACGYCRVLDGHGPTCPFGKPVEGR